MLQPLSQSTLYPDISQNVSALIYINSVTKFTVSLGLRMVLDNEGAVHWNQVMAMSVVTILPCVLVFFLAQKYFVEGISTTGLKG